MKQKTQKTMET